jgi:hypothetical protein
MLREFPRVTATLLIVLAAVAAPLDAQRRDDKKNAESGMNPAQRQELLPVFRLVDEVMKGTAPGTYTVPAVAKEPATAPQPVAAPGDVPLTWRNDFLKAQGDLIYVPFSVTIEPGRLAAPSVAAYLRVAPKGSTGLPTPAAPPEPERGRRDRNRDAKEQKEQKEQPSYPFEDVYFTDLRATAGQPLKLTRAFAVPAGSYDVYVALRERAAGGSPADAPIKIAVLKQELTIPNFHADELQTSSLILADKIEQLSAPLPAEAQKERPYVLGDAEITPAVDAKFKKTEELQVIFQVYGARFGDDKKPDITVEYLFHQKDGAGEKLFNKTPPQTFNAQSLPPNFDPAAGHQIVAGQAIPLTTFPEGDFRLEIKITDNKASKSLSREVLFSVVPAS